MDYRNVLEFRTNCPQQPILRHCGQISLSIDYRFRWNAKKAQNTWLNVELAKKNQTLHWLNKRRVITPYRARAKLRKHAHIYTAHTSACISRTQQYNDRQCVRAAGRESLDPTTNFSRTLDFSEKRRAQAIVVPFASEYFVIKTLW